jgi:hypothetical protein
MTRRITPFHVHERNGLARRLHAMVRHHRAGGYAGEQERLLRVPIVETEAASSSFSRLFGLQSLVIGSRFLGGDGPPGSR